MSAPAQYPELPEPADSAYINGPQGGEYRSLANSFEPGCAMFSPDQMRAYVDAAREQDRARAAAPDHWQRQGAEAWHAVCDALIKNWGDGALSEGSEGVMRLVEMLATEAKAYRAAGRPLSRAAAPQPAVGVSDEQIEAIALARYKVVPAHGSMFWSHAVVAGDGVQQLYVGRDVECQNMAAKFTGAFLDGAFVAISATKPEAPASEQQRLMINFDQVGTAGPFPVVDGRVHLPSVTMLDLARMLKPTMDSLAAADVPAVEQEASQREKAHKGPLVGEQVPPSINEVNRTAVVADDAIVDPAYLAAYEAAGRVGQIATPPAKAPAEAPANDGGPILMWHQRIKHEHPDE